MDNLKITERKPVMTQRKGRKLIATVIQNTLISPVRIATASNKLIGKKKRDVILRWRLKEININNYVVREVVDISEINKAASSLS